MANDCLVTKLKSVVDNDNLRVLGELKFMVTPSNGNVQLQIRCRQDAYIYAENATTSEYHFIDLNNVQTINFVAVDNTKPIVFKFVPRYGIDIFKVTIGELLYIDLELFDYLADGLSEIATVANVGNTECVGSIDVFGKYTLLNSVSMTRMRSVTGSIQDAFGLCPTIGAIELTSCIEVKGRIESLVERQVAHSRVSGTLTTNTKYTKVTFHDSLLNNYNLSITFGASNVIVKNASTQETIGTYTIASGTWSYS